MRSLFALLFLTVTLAVPPALAQEADLLLTKSGPAEAPAGSDVSYDIALTNLGPDAASNVAINDDIPAGMTFVSATQDSGPAVSCSTPDAGDPGTVTCTLATLAAGATVELTFVFNIPAQTPPNTIFTNFVTKSSDTFDPNEENDTGITTTTTPGPPQADVFVAKSAPGAAGPDTDLVYTITIGNSGPADAEDVTLTDTLPGDLTFVSLTQENGPLLSCTTPAAGAGGTITCTATSFVADASATLTLTAHVPDETAAGTEYTNTAVVASANDPSEENDGATTTTVVSAVDLAVTKSGPATAIAGEEISYVLTLTNNGPDLASTVQLLDTLPPGTTFVSLTQTSGPVFSCGTPRPGEGGSIGCIIGVLAPNDPAELTLVVNTGDTTSLTNTAATVSESFDTDPTNDEASVTTTVTPNADLSVVKSGPETVVAGENITYTITVANGGVSSASSVSLTDALPAQTTFVSLTRTSGSSFTCTTPAPGANGTITCTRPTFASGASTTFQLVARVAPNATGSLENTASVTSATGDTDQADNASTDSATITASADVTVAKDAAATVTAGGNVTYAIVVENDGPSDAASVTLTDALPAGTTFVSLNQSGPTFSCTTPAAGANGTVTCTIATLASGAATAFELVAHVPSDATGTIENTATVDTTTTDPAAGNDTSTDSSTVVASANLSVMKEHIGDATAGETIDYGLEVTNSGPSDATDVVLADVLPPNTTFVSVTQHTGPTFTCITPAPGATGTVSCTVPSFADGASATFTLLLDIASGAQGTIENTATISSATADPFPAGNQSTVTTPLVLDSDVALAKSAPATATAGTDVTYTLITSNSGPSDAVNLTLTDTLPAGTTFVSITQTGGPSFGCIAATCTGPLLPVGASATFELVANINPGTTGTIENSATVTSESDNATPANNTDTASTVVTSSADVTVTKTAVAAASAGTDITYTIVVANAGPSNAANVTLTDVLPPQATFVSLTQTAGPAFACAATTCTIAALAADATATFELVASVASNATGTIDNTATVATTTPDPVPANNTSTASTVIGANADLVVTKSAAAAATAGSDLTYTVTVTNAGPSDAVNVTLTDALPAQTTFVSAEQTSGPAFACTTPAAGAPGTIICSIATLAASSSATFSFVVEIAPDATGTIDNSASVSSPTPDPSPANRSGSTSTAIGSATTDLSITKTADAGTYTAGASATYTLVVTNNGPAIATGVTVTDVLPAGATLTSATPTQGTCSGTTTITCTLGFLGVDATATITLVVTLPTMPGPVANTATVTSGQADPAPANNVSTSTVSVVPAVVQGIPTLSTWMLILFAISLSGIAIMTGRVGR